MSKTQKIPLKLRTILVVMFRFFISIRIVFSVSKVKKFFLSSETNSLNMRNRGHCRESPVSEEKDDYSLTLPLHDEAESTDFEILNY